MTDEKLEKEAEEWLDKRYLKDMGVRKPCKQAYLAGAVPREKRISDLEAQIKKMSELINRYYMVCAEIPKELRTMVFDSCMEDTRKMVKELKTK